MLKRIQKNFLIYNKMLDKYNVCFYNIFKFKIYKF